MLVLSIIGILGATAIPSYHGYQDRARIASVIVQMKSIETEILGFKAGTGRTPVSLDEIGLGALTDPWGNAYEYVDHATQPRGQHRKDKFLVPINSDFDLSSKGPDGRSVAPLTSRLSRDDIIRANDGSFYGRASAY